MITWFLNLFRKTPKVGEVWLINGPNGNKLEAIVRRVNERNVHLIVALYNEIELPVSATHDEFHQILKIKRISK